MEHSLAIENYAKKKSEKIDTFLKSISEPHDYEFHLSSHPNHAHQEISIHLKSKSLTLTVVAEGVDSYLIMDEASEKLISLVKKEKEKIRDSHRKGLTEKRKNEI
jgi:ribosomal subunit interface protein